MKEYKYIIAGAGLSGLVSGWELLKRGEDNFIILESRAVAGGRVKSTSGIDMGATWIHQPHTAIQTLCSELGLTLFTQFNGGKSVYVQEANASPQYFESDARDISYRISGGTIAIINALEVKLSDKIILNQVISHVKEEEGKLLIIGSENTFKAEKAVITLPPALAHTLNYTPDLPDNLRNILASKHTWMSNSIKLGIDYESPFWRLKGLSGTVFGPQSPVMELYDHCSEDGKSSALIGFVAETLRKVSANKRRETVLSYLEKYLGSEIQEYISYQEKDWSADTNTQVGEIVPRHLGAQYGDACFNDTYMNEKLIFSGTETSPSHGGYLEGAVISGLRAAKLITSLID